MRDFEESEFLFEYLGEILDKSLYDQRSAMGYCRYSFELVERQLYIDCEKFSNVARYLNHSCDPNCISYKVNLKDCPKIAIFAARKIRLGEEMTFNYATK